MSREGARSTSLISALMWNPTFEVVYIKYCTIYDLYIGFYDVESLLYLSCVIQCEAAVISFSHF